MICLSCKVESCAHTMTEKQHMALTEENVHLRALNEQYLGQIREQAKTIEAANLQLGKLKELTRLPIGPLEMRERFIEMMWPTEKPKGGCICGPEGKCDWHNVTDITTPLEKPKCEHKYNTIESNPQVCLKCGEESGANRNPKLDALVLELGRVVNERDDLKAFIEGVRAKAEGLLHSETYKKALGLADKPKDDSCENYIDGEGVHSRFCSAFEGNAQVHAPTCQFFKKPVGDCICPEVGFHQREFKAGCPLHDVQHKTSAVDQTKPRLQRSEDLAQPRNLFEKPNHEHRWGQWHFLTDDRTIEIRVCLECPQTQERKTEKRNDVVPPTEAVGGAGRCTCGSKSFMKALHGVGCPVRD